MSRPSIAELDEGNAPEPEAWRADALDPADAMLGTRVLPTRLGRMIDPGDLALGVDRRVWRYEGGRYVPDDEAIADRTYRLMGDWYTVRLPALARDAVTRREGFPRLTDAPPDPRLINVRNGMVEVETGHLWPHSPSWRSLVQLPVAYDPAAKCSQFDAWLAEVVPPGVVPLVWELIAYSISSDRSFQQAALLIGRPGSGKGTLLRVLEALVGHENVAHVPVSRMASTFEPAELYGRQLNIVGDAEGTYLPDTFAFKSIVAGDVIQAQRKNRDPFDFRPWAFHVQAANQLPQTGDATGGWLRRWVVVPFREDVVTDKTYPEHRLHAELPGIFAKAVRLLPDLRRTGRFTETPESLQPMLDLAQASDVVRLWLDDDEAITRHDPGDREASVSRRLAFTAYKTWAADSGHRQPLTAQVFTRRLHDLGYEERKVRGERSWRGLAIDPVRAQNRWMAPSA